MILCVNCSVGVCLPFDNLSCLSSSMIFFMRTGPISQPESWWVLWLSPQTKMPKIQKLVGKSNHLFQKYAQQIGKSFPQVSGWHFQTSLSNHLRKATPPGSKYCFNSSSWLLAPLGILLYLYLAATRHCAKPLRHSWPSKTEQWLAVGGTKWLSHVSMCQGRSTSCSGWSSHLW